jgi:hypothetical protein
MTRLIGEFLWKLLLFTGGCLLLHYFFQASLARSFEFFLPLWQVYIFLGLLTLSGYVLVLLVHQRDPDKTGMAFIAIGFLKMLAAVLFLYPLISSEKNELLVQVLAFFVPYFFYLGFDTYFTVRLISKK